MGHVMVIQLMCLGAGGVCWPVCDELRRGPAPRLVVGLAEGACLGALFGATLPVLLVDDLPIMSALLALVGLVTFVECGLPVALFGIRGRR